MSYSENNDNETGQHQKGLSTWMKPKKFESTGKKQYTFGMANHFDQNAREEIPINNDESDSDMQNDVDEYKSSMSQKMFSASSKSILSQKHQSKTPVKINSINFDVTNSMQDQNAKQIAGEHDSSDASLTLDNPEKYAEEPSNEDKDRKSKMLFGESDNDEEVVDLDEQFIEPSRNRKVFQSTIVSLILATGKTKISIEELKKRYKESLDIDLGDALKSANYDTVFDINKEQKGSLRVNREADNNLVFEVIKMDEMNELLHGEFLQATGKEAPKSKSSVQHGKSPIQEISSDSEDNEKSAETFANKKPFDLKPLSAQTVQRGTFTSILHGKKPSNFQPFSTQSDKEEKQAVQNVLSKKPWDFKPKQYNQEGKSDSSVLSKNQWSVKPKLDQEEKKVAPNVLSKKPWDFKPKSSSNQEEKSSVLLKNQWAVKPKLDQKEKQVAPNILSKKPWDFKPKTFNQEEKSVSSVLPESKLDQEEKQAAPNILSKKPWDFKPKSFNQEEKSDSSVLPKSKINQEENKSASSVLSQEPKQQILDEEHENSHLKNIKVFLQAALSKQPQIKLKQVRRNIEHEIGEPLGITKSKEIFGFQPKTFGHAINSLGQFCVKKINGISYVVLNNDYLATEDDEDYLATEDEDS